MVAEEQDLLQSSLEEGETPRPRAERRRALLFGTALVAALVVGAALGRRTLRPQGDGTALTGLWAPAPAPPVDVVPPIEDQCTDREDCLQHVDQYLASAPRGQLGLLQTYSKPIGGGPCGPLCELQRDYEHLQSRCDTYDNAVAAVYYVKRGYLEEAKKILDTFTTLLYPSDLTGIYPEEFYEGLPSGRAMTLLAASYNCAKLAEAGDYRKPTVTDGAVDTGNNAWAALAFVHYARAANSGCHAAVAMDILHALRMGGSCNDDLGGFLGRLPPYRENHRSIEHNIDVLALAGLLGASAEQEQAAQFVRTMYGRNEAFPASYSMGTPSDKRCDTSQPKDAPIPADGTFWNILADLEGEEEHLEAAMLFGLGRGNLWAEDVDFIGNGNHPPPHLSGVQFTTSGNGVQWENTAGAALAMAYYLQKQSSEGLAVSASLDRLLNLRLRQSRGSLRQLLKMYGAIPGSILGGNYEAFQNGDTRSSFPGGSDTGLGFTYERFLHTASTAWTGLLLLYQADDNGPVNPDANPLGRSSKDLPALDGSCLPYQTQSTVRSATCRQDGN